MTIRSLVGTSLGALLLVACSAAATSSPNNTGNGDGGAGSNQDSAAGGGGTATISFPDKCPAFQPCGGNALGTWDYTDGCVQNPFTGLQSACPAVTVTGLTGTARGSITLTATTVTRSATVTTSATVNVPSSCAQPIGGCAVVEKQLTDAGFVAACAGAGDCSCSVSRTEQLDDASAYTASGNTITLASGDKYDYCLGQGTLGYQAQNQTKESGRFDLKKR